MSEALFPVPVDQPLSDEPKYAGLKFGMVFQRFLKAISDDMLAANIVNNLAPTSIVSPVVPDMTQAQLNAIAKSVKYTLNANRCDVTYYNTEPLTVPLVINLPYTAALAFDIDGTVYAPTTATLVKQVTIPANTGYVRFWYVVQATRN